MLARMWGAVLLKYCLFLTGLVHGLEALAGPPNAHHRCGIRHGGVAVPGEDHGHYGGHVPWIRAISKRHVNSPVNEILTKAIKRSGIVGHGNQGTSEHLGNVLSIRDNSSLLR